MAIKDCIEKFVTAGFKDSVLSSSKKIQGVADRLENIYTSEGHPNARVAAEQEAIRRFTEDTARREFSAINDKNILDKNIEYLNTSKTKDRGLEDVLNKTYYDQAAVLGQHTGPLAEMVDRFRAKIPGSVDIYMKKWQAAGEDLVRAMFGDTKGIMPDIVNIAKAYKDVNQTLIQRAKEAGINVRELKDYNVSYARDGHRIGNVPKKEYIDDMMKELDKKQMRNADGLPLTDDEIRSILSDEWDTLRSKPSAIGFGKGSKLLGSLNADSGFHRVYAFKDSEAYLRIQGKYGKGDPVTNMMSQLQMMGRDIALAENLGSKPSQGYNFLKNHVDINEGLSKNPLWTTDMMWKVVSGQADGIKNETVAAISSTIQGLVAAKALSNVGINSLGDHATIHSQLSLWGNAYSNTIGKALKSVVTDLTGQERRHYLSRMGYNITNILTKHSGSERAAELNNTMARGNKAASALADATTRLSLGDATLEANKSIFINEFENMMFDKAHLSWANLPEPVRNGLTYNKILPEDWEIIRQSATTEDKYGQFMDVAKMPEKIGTKYLNMRLNELSTAVPETSLITRAILTGGKQIGTVERTVRATFGTFLSYPITNAYRTVRIMNEHPQLNGTMNKITFAAHHLVSGALLGGLVIDTKELLSGKDPLAYDDPMFWAQAITYSNFMGLGFAVNQLKSINESMSKDAEITAKKFIETNIPPALFLVADLMSTGINTASHGLSAAKELVKGNVPAATEEAKQSGLSTAKFIVKNFPLDTFYTHLLTMRAFKDQFRYIAEPDANDTFRAIDRRLQKQTGQGYWWDRGDMFPSRLPKFPTKPKD